jgi:hypothetical protein
MCGAFLTGVWWVFPLIGFLLCLGFMVVAFRFARTGRGCLCMGGPRGNVGDQSGQVRAGVDTKTSH